MIDHLKSIGIEKGKSFKPDASTRHALEEAAREVSAWIDLKYEDLYATPYFSGTRTKKRGWLDHCAIRRRRQRDEFPAHHAGMELRRAVVPPAPRNCEWQLALSRCAAHWRRQDGGLRDRVSIVAIRGARAGSRCRPAQVVMLQEVFPFTPLRRLEGRCQR